MRVLSGVILLLACLGLDGCAVTGSAGGGSGVITFGKGINNSDLSVTGKTNTFQTGATISYSFQPDTAITGGNATVEIDKRVGDTHTVADRGVVEVPSGGGNQFAATYDSSGLNAGDYTMYILIAKNQIVAQGDFKLMGSGDHGTVGGTSTPQVLADTPTPVPPTETPSAADTPTPAAPAETPSAADTSTAAPAGSTPVPTAGQVSLVNVSAEETSPQSGDTIHLDYKIDNETGAPMQLILGASLFPAGSTSGEIDDTPDDATVTADTGVNTYQRQFVIPQASAGGAYDLVASIDSPGFTHEYDRQRVKSILTVGGQ